MALLLLGCSATSTIPSTPPCIPEPDELTANTYPGEYLWGVWDISFDAAALTAQAVPARRCNELYDITDMLLPPECSNCLIIDVLEFKPTEKFLKLKLSLRNPTNLKAYDVRGIIKVMHDEYYLANADSYVRITTLSWEKYHPFKAFAVDQPKRLFAPGTAHARIYEIYADDLEAFLNMELIVEASWPGNCKEPYEIRNAHATGVFLDYKKNDIVCEVLTWAGGGDIEYVSMDFTCLGQPHNYGGYSHKSMVHQHDNLWIYKDAYWHFGGEPAGTYKALIWAKAEGSKDPLFNYVDITIDASPPTVGGALIWGGSNGECEALDTAVDDLGNVYVLGVFGGTVDFDPGPGVTEYAGGEIYLSKFAPTGVLTWVDIWENEDGLLRAGDVVVDSNGGVYILGIFSGSFDCDPGEGTFNLTELDWCSLTEFICKLSPDGGFDWAAATGRKSSALILQGLTLDVADNVYVTGSFTYTMDFDPGSGVDEHEAIDKWDVYLTKFDTDGNHIWTRTWGGESYECGTDVEVYKDSVYVVGWFGEAADFDPGPGIDLHGTPETCCKPFVSKLNTDGEYIWALDWNESGTLCFLNCAYDVETDAGGRIYITGLVCGGYAPGNSYDLKPGPGEDLHYIAVFSDIYLVKLDQRGNYLWGSVINTLDEHTGDDAYNANAPRLAISNSQNVYLSSELDRAAEFDTGPGLDCFMTNPEHSTSATLWCCDRDGQYKWARAWGHTDGRFQGPMDVDNQGYIYVVGTVFASSYESPTVDLDPGPWVGLVHCPGTVNAFLCKLDENGMW